MEPVPVQKVINPVEVDLEEFLASILSYANDESNGDVKLWTPPPPEIVEATIREVKEYYAAPKQGQKRNMTHYNRMKVYDVRRVGGELSAESMFLVFTTLQIGIFQHINNGFS